MKREPRQLPLLNKLSSFAYMYIHPIVYFLKTTFNEFLTHIYAFQKKKKKKNFTWNIHRDKDKLSLDLC